MQLHFETYLDRVLGGWIGKCLGGAVGARFEGNKSWIELDPREMFPPEVPPNDDLDLQVLWLQVLEEKGPALESDDLAEAWLTHCWYPWNEYGTFRQNWRLGIHPPYSGRFCNQFWETGMGCPIRSEIWGYVFPGAPDWAVSFAEKDGLLDHTDQSVGAEKMLAAMASMAFFISDPRRLIDMFIHYLPSGTPVERLTREALASFDVGLSLREARDRIMALAGHPEACDVQVNVPFTILGLLYGRGDLMQVLLSALKCGYDTDCTMATSAALVGELLGARRIPERLKATIGDTLVMGIEYRRPEMTLTALARDTARMSVLLAEACNTGVSFEGAPRFQPLPPTAKRPDARLRVDYGALPVVAPGEKVTVTVSVEGAVPTRAERSEATRITLEPPAGWDVQPSAFPVDSARHKASFAVRARDDSAEFPRRNLFTAYLTGVDKNYTYTFGVAGAELWKFLGVYYDPVPTEPTPKQRWWQHHFVSLQREYIPEPPDDVDHLFRRWSTLLGRPAVIVSREREIDPGQLVGLRGEFCVYCARTTISPRARPAYFVVGNNDGYRIYLNGEKVGEVDEYVWWTPHNNAHKVNLRPGENDIVVKLVKRGDQLQFTFGIRDLTGQPMGFVSEDWVVDLIDRNPLVDLHV